MTRPHSVEVTHKSPKRLHTCTAPTLRAEKANVRIYILEKTSHWRQHQKRIKGDARPPLVWHGIRIHKSGVIKLITKMMRDRKRVPHC